MRWVPGNVAAAGLLVVGALIVAPVADAPASGKSARRQVIAIVEQIKRADYEGNRPALKTLFSAWRPFIGHKDLASRVHYWRGFALWRRALNGFTRVARSREQESDLTLANDEFLASAAGDPGFVDAKWGACRASAT